MEIRQNRADCLGYYGVARDLAVLYKINLTLPQINTINYADIPVPVTISSSDVHRIQATSISGIKIIRPRLVSQIFKTSRYKFHQYLG